MRVALFTDTFLPKVDGIVTVIRLLLDHMAARGVDAVVIAPRLHGTNRHDSYGAFRVLRPTSVFFPLYPELRIGLPTPSTYRALRGFNPDVVHIIHPAALTASGLWMAKRLGVPVVASFHLDFARLADHYRVPFMKPLLNAWARGHFNAADLALAPSRAVQRDMQRIGVREVGLWRRGVDAQRFHPRHRSDAMRARLSDGHPDASLLLYVGRLSVEKQLPQLRAVLDALPHVRLALVGDGPARACLAAHFADTPTVFTGYLTGDALYAAYASADLFVFPSSMETFGLVVTEAMAAGLGVVASRVGGVPDVIDEGVTGYTFAPGDVGSLVEGVRRAVSDPNHLRAMGQRARAFAETQAWPAMMDELLAHYARLKAQRPA